MFQIQYKTELYVVFWVFIFFFPPWLPRVTWIGFLLQKEESVIWLDCGIVLWICQMTLQNSQWAAAIHALFEEADLQYIFRNHVSCSVNKIWIKLLVGFNEKLLSNMLLKPKFQTPVQIKHNYETELCIKNKVNGNHSPGTWSLQIKKYEIVWTLCLRRIGEWISFSFILSRNKSPFYKWTVCSKLWNILDKCWHQDVMFFYP